MYISVYILLICVTWCSRNYVTIIAVSHFLFSFCRLVYTSSTALPPPPPALSTLQISVFILSNIVGNFEFSSPSLDCMFVYFEFVTV